MARNKTPLRYPGGKQRLTPFILELLEANGLQGGHYVEPYAGGAGVGMELLVSGHVETVHLNDSSLPIYAFWQAAVHDTDAFCARISRADLNIEEWRRQREILRNPTQHNVIDLGFATFYLNRTNRSGVLSGGVIGGLDQTGRWKMDARFPRNELIRRLEVIGSLRDAIHIRNSDAEEFITHYVPELPENTLVYCDPPYFEKASRLYLNHYAPNDHQRIAGIIQAQQHRKWIVSYDAVDQILGYYSPRRKFLYSLQYNAARAYKGSEVFVFSDDLVVPRASSLPFISEALERHAVELYNMFPQDQAAA